MRLSADPIQCRRQVKELQLSANTAAHMGPTDQERITGRMAFHILPTFMGTVAGEIYNDTLPPLVLGALVEIIGKMVASAVQTIVEDDDQEQAASNLVTAALQIAMAEIARDRAAAQPKETRQ